jgi:hypothetical protein
MAAANGAADLVPFVPEIAPFYAAWIDVISPVCGGGVGFLLHFSFLLAIYMSLFVLVGFSCHRPTLLFFLSSPILAFLPPIQRIFFPSPFIGFLRSGFWFVFFFFVQFLFHFFLSCSVAVFW